MASVTATPRRVRTASAYRAFDVAVARVVRLSPSFVRVTFVGDDLADLGRAGLDQRLKLALPAPDGTPARREDFDGDDWFARWREAPASERSPMRTYTVRAIRGAGTATELDIDMVLHGTGPAAGPASRWAAALSPGATAVISGPNARWQGDAVGLEWAPPIGARRVVLAGDETAAPAIAAICESLAPGTDAEAYIEIPVPQDALDLTLPAGVRLTWLPRVPGLPADVVVGPAGEVTLPGGTRVAAHDGAPLPHGARLDDAVRRAMAARVDGCGICTVGRSCGLGHARLPDVVEDVDVDTTVLWDTPATQARAGAADSPVEPTGAADGCYAWIAGEAATVRDLRRHLVQDLGADRRWVAFMGYWRLGRAEC
ncbi:siderophore-interacting protein [Sanguibacter sp. A247]|uniref:siderophore-interacting protein n=1 Tax=unclassified Sanguibacter TaxID=2645534 RepID=UPI003FD7B2BB